MNRFRNFMVGRYGTDHLTTALLSIGVIFTFVGTAFDWQAFIIITYILFIICIFRTMSKNTLARRKENNKFLEYWNPIVRWFKKKHSAFKLRKDYKYFKCPNCKKELRAPRGKGKISVTCQKCGTKFIQKS